jgi:hypothetical protein
VWSWDTVLRKEEEEGKAAAGPGRGESGVPMSIRPSRIKVAWIDSPPAQPTTDFHDAPTQDADVIMQDLDPTLVPGDHRLQRQPSFVIGAGSNQLSSTKQAGSMANDMVSSTEYAGNPITKYVFVIKVFGMRTHSWVGDLRRIATQRFDQTRAPTTCRELGRKISAHFRLEQ